jgi:hypothetical protein
MDLGDGTSRGATDRLVSEFSGSPCARSIGATSSGGRVDTIRRCRIASGGLDAPAVAGITLAATGLTASGPRIGVSCCTSVWLRRRTGSTRSRPKRSAGTPTTPFTTWTFL